MIHLTNLHVLTMNPSHTSAAGLALGDGRIVALDPPQHDGARAVDCRGGVLVPGFIDPHVHMLAAAAAARSVDCSPGAVRSIREIGERIAAAPASAGGWVRAVGYDESALAEGRHPTRWDLDAAAPDRPVRLLHRSGHAAVLNSRALALAGITIASEEPPGGVIDRRLDDGEPTGLLIDMDEVIERFVPPLPFDDLVLGMSALDARLTQAGVTAVQDMTHRNDAERLALLDRVCNAARFRAHRLPPATRPGVPGPGPVKLMLAEAGGLSRGVRGALAEEVARAHASRRQVAVHAVTAETVGAALDAIEAALRDAPRPDHRHRIEHASICPPAAAERAARLGVVVVSNPAFLYESGERYRRTVDETQVPHLYAAGTLVRAGVRVAAASDVPVAAPEPLTGVQAAIARRSSAGVHLPGEPVGVADALALVTREAAFAAFADQEHGVIVPGRAADLVLLDREPGGQTPPTVWWTLLGGMPAYVADTAPPFPPRA